MNARSSASDKTAPLAPVSVVIPCYCCKDTIGRAVHSVAAQSLRPAEVILVDDCSPDDTLKTLQQIASQHPGGWVRIMALPENVGAATARNRGWESASTPLIAFLDADDAWHPRKIEIQYEFMQQHPDIVLSAHESLRLNDEHRITELALPTLAADALPVSRNALLRSNRFITPSVMLRREIPYRFLEGRRHMEDHLLWMRIACNGLRIDKLTVVLAYTFKAAYGDAGLSSQMLPMAVGDLANYRQLRTEKLISAPMAWALYAYSLLKTIRRFLLAAFGRHPVVASHP